MDESIRVLTTRVRQQLCTAVSRDALPDAVTSPAAQRECCLPAPSAEPMAPAALLEPAGRATTLGPGGSRLAEECDGDLASPPADFPFQALPRLPGEATSRPSCQPGVETLPRSDPGKGQHRGDQTSHTDCTAPPTKTRASTATSKAIARAGDVPDVPSAHAPQVRKARGHVSRMQPMADVPRVAPPQRVRRLHWPVIGTLMAAAAGMTTALNTAWTSLVHFNMMPSVPLEISRVRSPDSSRGPTSSGQGETHQTSSRLVQSSLRPVDHSSMDEHAYSRNPWRPRGLRP